MSSLPSKRYSKSNRCESSRASIRSDLRWLNIEIPYAAQSVSIRIGLRLRSETRESRSTAHANVTLGFLFDITVAFLTLIYLPLLRHRYTFLQVLSSWNKTQDFSRQLKKPS